MSSSKKKVIVRRFSRDWVAGYVSPQSFVHDGALELLGLDAKVNTLALDAVKMVCFVRDFQSGDPVNPERLLRRSFAARPRTEGLWLRLQFRDNDSLEILAPNDVSLLHPDGLHGSPPDTRSNTQRVFIPRLAIAELTVIAAIGISTKPPRPPRPADPLQETLFSPPRTFP